MSDNKGLEIMDILNFCILSTKYRHVMTDDLKEKLDDNEEMIDNCMESFSDWLGLMKDSVDTINDLFKHSQTVGYTEDFFKAMKEYKSIWKKGADMVNRFNNTLEVISTPPGDKIEEVMEKPKYLS